MMPVTRIVRWLRAAWRSQSGIAAVEFVLILPILALLLFGTIEIGRILFDYHAVSKSVRDAARYVARVTEINGVETFSDFATCAVDQTTAVGSPTQNARNLALTGTANGSGGYILNYWTDTTTVSVSGACFDNSAGTYQGFYAGRDVPIVTVEATVSFPLMNGWLLGLNDFLTFKISHQEVFIGE
jgi:Flp pilus assembly protein TadG